jgi:hypothetical protein
VLLVGLPIALLLASAVGYAVVAGALHPVERMRRHADGISEATSDARLPLPPPTTKSIGSAKPSTTCSPASAQPPSRNANS